MALRVSVVVRSSRPLKVTGVYTAAGLTREGEIEGVSSLDVEEVSAAEAKRPMGP